jgi:hypothetical protein
VNSAESTFSSSCAQGNYSASLADLAKPPVEGQPAFISPDLNLNGILKSGYTVTLGAGEAAAAPDTVVVCNATSAFAGYAAWADPQTLGTTGQRYFGTNTTGTIWQHTGTLSAITAADTAGAGGTPIQ